MDRSQAISWYPGKQPHAHGLGGLGVGFGGPKTAEKGKSLQGTPMGKQGWKEMTRGGNSLGAVSGDVKKTAGKTKKRGHRGIKRGLERLPVKALTSLGIETQGFGIGSEGRIATGNGLNGGWGEERGPG